ncbi:MAG: AMP-binding protein [Bacteroidales bacterium]|nr:AMP-binding protein [Bacteroidales bacterium]
MKSLLRGVGLYGNFISIDEMPSFCRKLLSKRNFPDWEKKIFGFILDFLDRSEEVVQESSGTTGLPKTILISKKAMIHSALRTIRKFKIRQGMTALLCLPVDYIAGKMMIVRALTAGMHLSWIEPTAKPDIRTDKTIDFCAMVPLQVFNLLEEHSLFSAIKTLITGGSELSPELEYRLQQVPSRVFETFGMAETCSHIALRRINGPLAKSWFNVLPGIKISTDNRGCLVINASYLSNPVITNDSVDIIGRNRFYWKGRIDNIINSGGIKINPESVEKIIYEITGDESYLVGIPDHKLGQKPVLVTQRLYSPDEKERLLKQMRTNLPAYHFPADIITIDSFPRNKALKINRTGMAAQVIKKVHTGL